MSTKRASIHGLWSGQLAFILAATGSAVGLSNIWKFPYIIGENGGGAFLLIGIPVMMAEVMLGRRGSFSPVNTMRVLAIEEHASARWTWLGGAGLFLASLLSLGSDFLLLRLAANRLIRIH